MAKIKLIKVIASDYLIYIYKKDVGIEHKVLKQSKSC